LFELILQRIIEAVAHKGQQQVKENVPLIGNEENVSIRDYENTCCGKYFSFGRVRPLAWIILCGDFVHNIADAITIGAAVSQSLTLGLTTTIAIALHELPHELADFAILLKCGMHWGTALMFNFLSSLLAAIGFFIGAAISTSVDASDWLLAIAAGSFLYISLVDLLPELLNGHSHSHDHEQSSNGTVEKKPMSCGDHVIRNVVICIGFFISFVVLLLLTLFEDKIDDLFH
jgi:zinc transporter ZupT